VGRESVRGAEKKFQKGETLIPKIKVKTSIGREEEEYSSSPDSLSSPKVRFPLDVSLKPWIYALCV
jgi:hypothetical protein